MGTTMMRPDIHGPLDEAIKALIRFELAVEDQLKFDIRESGMNADEARDFLLEYARNARAQWSGGPLGRQNVQETVMRDQALALSSDYELMRILRKPANTEQGE